MDSTSHKMYLKELAAYEYGDEKRSLKSWLRRKEKRSEGLCELIETFRDIVYIKDKVKTMNWFKRRRFNKYGKDNMKQYNVYEWLDPVNQLEAYNCAYERLIQK